MADKTAIAVRLVEERAREEAEFQSQFPVHAEGYLDFLEPGEGDVPEIPERISGKDRAAHALTTLAALTEPEFAETYRSAALLGKKAYNDLWVAKVAPLVPTNHLSAQIACTRDKLHDCGKEGHTKCGQRCCPRCRSKLAYRMKERVKEASGGALSESQRESLRFITVLNELILPPPVIISSQGSLEDAFQHELAVSSPSQAIKLHLKRQQEKARAYVRTELRRRKISEDHILKLERPANSTLRSQFHRDVQHLHLMNEKILGSRGMKGLQGRLRGFRRVNGIKRTKLKNVYNPLYVPLRPRPCSNDPESFVRDYTHDEMMEMQQFLGAEPLKKNEMFKIAREMQKVRNDYDKVDFSAYPDFLRFETTVKGALERGRRKLNRIQKALPGIKIVGSFELELINLQAALSPELASSKKSTTIMELARFGMAIGKNSTRASAKAMRGFLGKVGDGNLSGLKKHGIRHAILLHFHAVAIGRESNLHDLEQCLTGNSGTSKRRFKGLFPIKNQVDIKRLHAEDSVDENIMNISNYCFKFESRFKFDFMKCDAHDRDIPFPELGVLIWLYSIISERGLGITMGVDDDTFESTRKARPKVRSLADDIPPDREAYIRIASNGSPEQRATANRLIEEEPAETIGITLEENLRRNVTCLSAAFEPATIQ